MRAGLVIEVSEDINISSIKSIRIEGNDIVVFYNFNAKKVIHLPEGGMDNLLLWVKQSCSGPFLISVDNALVPGAGSTYTPPCMPSGLANLMVNYDVYAHTIGQGDIPIDSLLHPLIRRTGNMSMMPHLQFQRLMQENNKSPEALWYRELAARYPSRPGAIGYFTIKALPSSKGFPVAIEVISQRSYRPSLWYREVTAPSEFDNIAFDLPYAPLKKDIETHFDEYRKSFEPFDELASFVEAYALLKKIAQQKPDLWNQLIRLKCKNNELQCLRAGAIYGKSGPASSWNDYWASDPDWSEWSVGSIGLAVETSQEADLALCHLWNLDYGSNYHIDYEDILNWVEGIDAMAEKDPDIKAKYLLYQFRYETYSEDSRKELLDEFLEITRRNKELMRLRIAGCNIILNSDAADWVSDIIEEEKELIIRDYAAAVEALKKQQGTAKGDLLPWEDLIQTVYSSGFLTLLKNNRLAATYNRYYDPKFVRALADVHYNRGMAFQRGEEFVYQHAHFRYLGYLSKNANTEMRSLIKDYQTVLAKHMGISGWMESDYSFTDDSGMEEGEDEYMEKDATIDSWKNYPYIEGELMSAQALFSKNGKSSLPQDGSPIDIRSDNGTFQLLLLDSRLFAPTTKLRSNRVRAYGIPYEGINAFTPLRIEVKSKTGNWIPVNIPHSGTSVRGIFNAQ